MPPKKLARHEATYQKVAKVTGGVSLVCVGFLFQAPLLNWLPFYDTLCLYALMVLMVAFPITWVSLMGMSKHEQTGPIRWGRGSSGGSVHHYHGESGGGSGWFDGGASAEASWSDGSSSSDSGASASGDFS